MKYWIITDTHLGHTKMAFKDYFGRPEDFEEKVLKGLSVIGAEDTFIHLGDVCWSKENPWHEKIWGACRAKYKWLCLGNHDSKSMNWYLSHGWSFVGECFEIKMYGRRILFSHKPMVDNGYDLNIHGHFHTAPEDNHEPELRAIKNDKQMLLTAEGQNYRPITLKSLVDKFDGVRS